MPENESDQLPTSYRPSSSTELRVEHNPTLDLALYQLLVRIDDKTLQEVALEIGTGRDDKPHISVFVRTKSGKWTLSGVTVRYAPRPRSRIPPGP